MNTEKLIDRGLSTAALVIATSALFVSWWQLEITKEHNRLGVRPRVMVTPYLEGPNGRNGLYISNPGLGPAIIKSMKITAGSSTFEGVGENLWPKILKTVDINPICFARGWPNEEAVVKAGEELVLLSTTKRADLSLCALEAAKLLSKQGMIITITYESMYGEQFSFKGSTQLNDPELTKIGQILQ